MAAEWNWRIVAISGLLAIGLIGAGAVGGVLGERDGLYLAFGGIISWVSAIIAVTIDWLAQRHASR